MTNEEAITILEELARCCNYEVVIDSEDVEALNKAIKVLKNERPKGKCKTCSHRDPEDKKCDCGGLERVGCQFPVSDNYYCKYYERRTWDAEEVDNEQREI